MNRPKLVHSDDSTRELPAANFSVSKTSSASSQVRVDIAGATHRGHVRKNNEDHFLALRAHRSLEMVCTNLEENSLERSFDETAYGLLVADGMGGMAAGEVASRMALYKIVELVANTPDWIMRLNQQKDEAAALERMTERFRQVDDALKYEAQQETSIANMGTTLTMAISLANRLVIGHIGDSRAYIMRGNTLHQLTSDHTLAQALVDAGIASPGDPTTRTLHHVLTAAIGAYPERADPQILSFNLFQNDQVLLCTDGLTELVSAETIGSVLSEADSSKAACDSLIDLALSAGGVDNVTVLLARYQFPDPAKE